MAERVTGCTASAETVPSPVAELTGNMPAVRATACKVPAVTTASVTAGMVTVITAEVTACVVTMMAAAGIMTVMAAEVNARIVPAAVPPKVPAAMTAATTATTAAFAP